MSNPIWLCCVATGRTILHTRAEPVKLRGLYLIRTIVSLGFALGFVLMSPFLLDLFGMEYTADTRTLGQLIAVELVVGGVIDRPACHPFGRNGLVWLRGDGGIALHLRCVWVLPVYEAHQIRAHIRGKVGWLFHFLRGRSRDKTGKIQPVVNCAGNPLLVHSPKSIFVCGSITPPANL